MLSQNDARGPCEVCGCNRSKELDGYLYCEDCGLQLPGGPLTYDESTPAMIKAGYKIKVKAVRKEKLAPKRKLHEEKSPDYSMRKRARVGEDYPFYLGNVGLRIATFAKLLVKISGILVKEYGVPNECNIFTLKLAQQYLRKFGCAFCDTEVGDPNEDRIKLYTPSFMKTNAEIKRLKLEAEEEARRKQEERNKQESQEYTVFAILSQDTHYSKMAPIVPEPVDVITDVKTDLRVEAVNLAGVLYLEIDAILAIVYYAAQLSGCRWIQISDMYRWYREGRFGVTKDQQLALFAASMWNPTDLMKRVRRRGWLHSDGVKPLSYVMRVFAYLTQFIGIPTSLSIMDFGEVCLRTIYNFDLPNAMADRVRHLAELLPPVNNDYGARSFAHLAPIDKNFKEKLFADYVWCGPHGFLNKVFDDKITADKKWEIIPLEVKAVALVLFALKLAFGLDGCREFRLKNDDFQPDTHSSYSEADSNVAASNAGADPSNARADPSDGDADQSDVFDFKRWLQQLKMRLKAWEGNLIEDVFRCREAAFDENAGDKKKRWRKFQCVPGYVRFEKGGMFVDTEGKLPPVKDVLGKSNDELFAPLRYQATKHKDFSRHANVEEENVEAFFTCFTESHMEYGLMEVESPKASKAIVVVDLEKKNEENFDTLLFPCADEYERVIPMDGLKAMSQHHAKLRGLNGMCPTLERSMIDALYESYKPHFSTTFAELLRLFSVVVGEREEMVLFSFAMVEAMLIDDVADMERHLRTGKWLQFPISDTKTYVASIRLTDTTSPAPQFRFEVATGTSDFQLAYTYALLFISFKHW